MEVCDTAQFHGEDDSFCCRMHSIAQHNTHVCDVMQTWSREHILPQKTFHRSTNSIARLFPSHNILSKKNSKTNFEKKFMCDVTLLWSREHVPSQNTDHRSMYACMCGCVRAQNNCVLCVCVCVRARAYLCTCVRVHTLVRVVACVRQ